MSCIIPDDPEIYQALQLESKRQRETINLIASENYASKAVLEAQGSFLTNKYAEGYPGKRYYGGCENADIIESLAIERAKELFHAEHANVQPHSGAQANMAAYHALLQPGDLVMGMNLSHGGHLTHGGKVNFSGKLYHFIDYGVKQETGRIDFPIMEKVAYEQKPKLIVAGASAYPRIIDFEHFRFVSDKIGAKLMVDMAHIAGLVAVGLHPSPIPYADIVTSTIHKTLRGPRGGFILCRKEYAQAIDSAVFPGIQGGPLVHVIAAKAIAFKEAMRPEFADYQKAVLDNARTLAKSLQDAGFKLVSGGTDIHMLMVDLNPLGITGKDSEEALGRAGIMANRNTIPFETKPPRIASGVRLGTPAATSRGMGKVEMVQIAAWIVEVLRNINDTDLQSRIRQQIAQMCSRFPVPGIDK
jgi:glycine hydroxymethyltransferase